LFSGDAQSIFTFCYPAFFLKTRPAASHFHFWRSASSVIPAPPLPPSFPLLSPWRPSSDTCLLFCFAHPAPARVDFFEDTILSSFFRPFPFLRLGEPISPTLRVPIVDARGMSLLPLPPPPGPPFLALFFSRCLFHPEPTLGPRPTLFFAREQVMFLPPPPLPQLPPPALHDSYSPALLKVFEALSPPSCIYPSFPNPLLALCLRFRSFLPLFLPGIWASHPCVPPETPFVSPTRVIFWIFPPPHTPRLLFFIPTFVFYDVARTLLPLVLFPPCHFFLPRFSLVFSSPPPSSGSVL